MLPIAYLHKHDYLLSCKTFGKPGQRKGAQITSHLRKSFKDKLLPQQAWNLSALCKALIKCKTFADFSGLCKAHMQSNTYRSLRLPYNWYTVWFMQQIQNYL